jgi:hypothetical protein
MKKLLLAALCALSLNANAQTPAVTVIPAGLSITRFILDLTDRDYVENTDPVVIQASGSGDTCEQALTAAKRHALEKVNGTWVHSVERSKDGSYEEDIVQYSGGVVKSYKYLKDDCTFVIIEAEVMKRSNRVQMESTDISKNQIVHLQGIKDAQDRKAKAIAKIDDRRKAIYFKTEKLSMQMSTDNYVDVTINGEFNYQDKWRADYKDLREMFGWFNLPSFAEDAAVLVTAVDGDGKKLFTRTIYRDWKAGGEWSMWKIKTWGVNRTVDVRIHEKDPVMLTVRVPYNQMVQVKSFIVEVI